MAKLGVLGATGRMGQAILGLLPSCQEWELWAAVARNPAPGVHGATGMTSLLGCDVVVDFSRPQATLDALEILLPAGIPLVVGTTGFSDEEKQKLLNASQSLPLLMAPNTSLGANVLFALAKRAARALSDFDAEIFEVHHRHKKDAPSGTALFLAQAVAEGRGQAPAGAIRQSGAREKEGVGFAVLRGGDGAGEHTVFFLGNGERLEITHRVHHRQVFASGALAAARYLLGRPPGAYTMADALGLAEDR